VEAMLIFKHRLLLRDARIRMECDLKGYLEVFQAITGKSDRAVSVEAQGEPVLLWLWRKGRRVLSIDKYDELVSYMDRVLSERSGLTGNDLSLWIDLHAQRIRPNAVVAIKRGRPRGSSNRKDTEHGKAPGITQQAKGKRIGKRIEKQAAEDGGHKRIGRPRSGASAQA